LATLETRDISTWSLGRARILEDWRTDCWEGR